MTNNGDQTKIHKENWQVIGSRVGGHLFQIGIGGWC